MRDDRWLREARKSAVLARTRKYPLGIESWLMALDDEVTRLTNLLAERDATIQRVRELTDKYDEVFAVEFASEPRGLVSTNLLRRALDGQEGR